MQAKLPITKPAVNAILLRFIHSHIKDLSKQIN